VIEARPSGLARTVWPWLLDDGHRECNLESGIHPPALPVGARPGSCISGWSDFNKSDQEMEITINAIPVEVGKPSASGSLLRVLGKVFALAVVIGATIGGGILYTPGKIAALLPNAWAYMAAWAFGGINALLGATVFAVGTFGAVLGVFALLLGVNLLPMSISLLVLRWREPDAPRPYRAWGYPRATWAAIFIGVFFIVTIALSDQRNGLIALAILLASYPVYRARGDCSS
jgi:amino acid transporter